MDGEVALLGVNLPGNFNKIHAAVVATIGEENEGSITLHAAEEGLVLGKAVAHVGHTAEDIEIALQLINSPVHRGAFPRTMGKDGAVRGNGVKAGIKLLIRDVGIDAMHDVFRNKDLVLSACH